MIYIGEKGAKIYAKVWKVDKREKYTALQVSTGDKQEDGTYKNSGWNVRLVGKANVHVNEGDNIVITKAKIENIYDKEKNRSWLNVIAFELEDRAEEENPFMDESSSEDDQLPF